MPCQQYDQTWKYICNLSHSWKTDKANLDLPETAFNEEALEKPAVNDSEEEKFITQNAQQNEGLAITLFNQPWSFWNSF